MFQIKILTSVFVMLISQNIKAQSWIKGNIDIDTSIWDPVIYMSIIPVFDEMYSMTTDMIIDKSTVDNNGRFYFSTQYFPTGDHFIRLHICKKNSPPASLIIGGIEENHFFLIANNKSQISIKDTSNIDLFKSIVVDGNYPNNMLQQIDEVASYLDSTSYNGSPVKIELIRNAIFEKLRLHADTCSNSLVSLYALYKSKFEKNVSVNQVFYKKYLSKWKHERSTYFLDFKKNISFSRSGVWLSILIAVSFFILGLFVCHAYLKFFRKNQNPLRNLSVQERRIFSLIMEGKSNKEISEVMKIGLSTVKSHVNSIYTKLDINSRKDVLNLNLDR